MTDRQGAPDGASAARLAALWDVFVRACGPRQVVNAGVQAVYDLGRADERAQHTTVNRAATARRLSSLVARCCEVRSTTGLAALNDLTEVAAYGAPVAAPALKCNACGARLEVVPRPSVPDAPWYVPPCSCREQHTRDLEDELARLRARVEP